MVSHLIHKLGTMTNFYFSRLYKKRACCR